MSTNAVDVTAMGYAFTTIKNSNNSQGKLTLKGLALKRDKLSRSSQRVFSHTTLTRDFMSMLRVLAGF